MHIHAIQTGNFITKQSFRLGKGRGRLRLVNMFLDRTWTETLPYYNWVIEHPEGVILIDTGETARALQPDYYPAINRFFIQQNTRIFVKPEDEIGPQLQTLGLKPDDVRWVILTHMHQDHVGGLRYFPKAKFLVSRPEYEATQTRIGQMMQGYMPQNWPEWFEPHLIDYAPQAIGPFPQSFTLTQAGDVHLVPTPGHSPGHLSVILDLNGLSFFFTGDTSFNQQLMLDQAIDGVAASEKKYYQTLDRINQYVRQNSTVYLPSHDPEAGERLTSHQIVGEVKKIIQNT